MSKITESARGEECTIRIYGVCNGNPETTVAAHFRLTGVNGIALKPPPFMIAYACSACHDEVDRRTDFTDGRDARLDHAMGVFRTQVLLAKKGLLKIG